MEHRWNEIDRGKPCPSATLSTTNPTWTEPVSDPGLRGGRPAANRLSHGTAQGRELLICHIAKTDSAFYSATYYVPEALPPRVKRPEFEANHLP
jgi:hypothetical protein